MFGFINGCVIGLVVRIKDGDFLCLKFAYDQLSLFQIFIHQAHVKLLMRYCM